MLKKANQLVFAECGRHSEKLEVVHKIIEECWDTEGNFEMFARKLREMEMLGKRDTEHV